MPSPKKKVVVNKEVKEVKEVKVVYDLFTPAIVDAERHRLDEKVQGVEELLYHGFKSKGCNGVSCHIVKVKDLKEIPSFKEYSEWVKYVKSSYDGELFIVGIANYFTK